MDVLKIIIVALFFTMPFFVVKINNLLDKKKRRK